MSAHQQWGPPARAFPHAAPTPYHLMLRTWGYSWWRPVVGVLLAVVAFFVGAALVYYLVAASYAGFQSGSWADDFRRDIDPGHVGAKIAWLAHQLIGQAKDGKPGSNREASLSQAAERGAVLGFARRAVRSRPRWKSMRRTTRIFSSRSLRKWKSRCRRWAGWNGSVNRASARSSKLSSPASAIRMKPGVSPAAAPCRRRLVRSCALSGSGAIARRKWPIAPPSTSCKTTP